MTNFQVFVFYLISKGCLKELKTPDKLPSIGSSIDSLWGGRYRGMAGSLEVTLQRFVIIKSA